MYELGVDRPCKNYTEVRYTNLIDYGRLEFLSAYTVQHIFKAFSHLWHNALFYGLTVKTKILVCNFHFYHRFLLRKSIPNTRIYIIQ